MNNIFIVFLCVFSTANAGCTNYPVGWTDGSDDCASYAANSYCAKYGTTVGTSGYTADQACCTCGGGSTYRAPTSACMWINTADGSRCGICGTGGCGGSYAPYKCYNTNQIGDQIEFQNADDCEAYVSGSSQVTLAAMQDENTGVPQIGYAMIMSMYSRSVPLHLSKNKTYMSQTRPANWSHTLNCVSPLTCMTQVNIGKLAAGNLTGWDVNNCAIAIGIECGEDALEIAACTYLTAGAGTALCKSKKGQAVFGVINSFVNKLIEKPIIEKVDSIEHGAIKAAKAVGHWFASWF